MGLFLMVTSAMDLFAGERPPIGLMVLFGFEFWSGWLSIVSDSVKNLRSTLGGLMDKRARIFDDDQPHPLIREIEDRAGGVEWVANAVARVRDQGQVFHVELSAPSPRVGRRHRRGQGERVTGPGSLSRVIVSGTSARQTTAIPRIHGTGPPKRETSAMTYGVAMPT